MTVRDLRKDLETIKDEVKAQVSTEGGSTRGVGPVVRRGLTYLAVALAAAAAFVTLAHLPAARSMALRWGLQSLRDRAGIDATARDVSYNLLTLDVRLRGLTATATGSSIPFLTADEVSVNLPWGAVFGTAAVERLDARGVVRRHRARCRRHAEPAEVARPPPPANPPRVVVGALALAGGRVRYRDMARQFSLDATGVDLAMAPVGQPASSRAALLDRDRSIACARRTWPWTARLTGSLAYDGSSLTLSGVSYRSHDRRTAHQRTARRAVGHRHGAADGGRRAWRWRTSARRSRSTRPSTGRVTLNGPITGELAKLSASAHGVERPGPLAAPGAARPSPPALVLTTDAVRIDRASLQLGGGRVSGTGGLAFDSGAASVDASWQGVPIDALVEGPLPGNLGALLTGRTALTWDTARGLQGLTGRIDTRADARRAARAVRAWSARPNWTWRATRGTCAATP